MDRGQALLPRYTELLKRYTLGSDALVREQALIDAAELAKTLQDVMNPAAGGTAVAGGNSNVPGIWGASLFMFLVVSMLNTYGFGAGIRLILTGLIIIAVIMLAGGRTAGKR